MRALPIAHCWLAGTRSGYFTSKDWQAWADEIIVLEEQPPIWLIEMSTADDLTSLLSALRGKFNEEKTGGSAEDTLGDATIGFYYLMYEDGRLSEVDLLRLVGEEAEGGMTTLECETAYEFLNEIEVQPRETHGSMKGRLQALLGPFGDTALRLLRVMEECKSRVKSGR